LYLLAVLAAVVVLLPTGCTKIGDLLGFVDYQKTSAGVKVDTRGYAVDMDKIDGDWRAVAECWGWSGGARGTVVSISDPVGVNSHGNEYFMYGGNMYMGYQVGLVVFVPPDLAALRHELSHRVCQLQRNPDCENGAGKCWLGRKKT
jgi:hypothetical protein